MLKEKVSQLNQQKAGVILSYSSMILGYGIAIVYTPLMLRLLGQSEYGLYNLVASVVSYLGLLNFGFGSAYIRYYSRYKVNNEQTNIDKLNGMFLIVFSIIGLIALGAGTILVLNTETILGNKLSMGEISTAKILMATMIFNIVISFPVTVFTSHITANERYVFQKAVQLFKVLVNPIIVVPVLLFGYKSVGMVMATTIISIFAEICNVVYCFKKLKISFMFKQFDFILMKEITIFSSFIFINIIIDQINWNVDKFILGRFHGTVAVAIYGLAAQLNGYYLSLSTAISSVFIPQVNRMVALNNDSDQLTDLFTRVGRIQFILLSLICSAIVFFGRPFIHLWAGSDYSDSYIIMLILVIPVTVPLIQNLGIEIQKAKNMHQFRSLVYFLIALGNVGLSIPLGKLYGGVGCAIGTAISLLFGNVLIMNWFYHNKIGLDMKYFWKQILVFVPSLLPPIVVGIFLLSMDFHSIILLLLGGIAYTIVFSFSLWFLGMNQYEKDLICKPFAKILRKLA